MGENSMKVQQGNKSAIKNLALAGVIFALYAIAWLAVSVVLCRGTGDGETLNDAIRFFLKYYEVYLYLGCAGLSVGLCFAFERKRRQGWGGLSWQLPIVLFAVVVAVLGTFAIYWMPMATEEVTVRVSYLPVLDDGGVGSVTLNGYAVYGKRYASPAVADGQWEADGTSYVFDGSDGQTQELTLRVAASPEWRFFFTKSKDAGSVEIYYHGEELAAQDLPDDGTVIVSYWSNWRMYAKVCLAKALFTLVCAGILYEVAEGVALLFARRLLPRLRNVGYEFAIFALLAIPLFVNSTTIDSYTSAWYVTNYSIGFGSRFLPGVIMHFICGDFISAKAAYAFVMIVTLAIYGCAAVCLGQCIRRSGDDTRRAVIFLALCCICSPAGITAYRSGGIYGRVEMFGLLFVLAGVMLYQVLPNRVLRYAVLGICVVASMAAYQGFAFLYFAIPFTVMAYDAFDGGKVHVRDLTGGILVCLAAAVSFIIFQCRTFVTFGTVDDLYAWIIGHTDMSVDREALQYEFFSDVFQNWKACVINRINGDKSYLREVTALTFCILVPIVAIIAGLWIRAVKLRRAGERAHFIWSPYFWIIFSDCFVLPQFLLNCDWSRWIIALVTVLFFQILYVSYRGDTYMTQALCGLQGFVSRHKILCAAVALYLLGLPRLDNAVVYSASVQIWNDLKSQFGLY